MYSISTLIVSYSLELSFTSSSFLVLSSEQNGASSSAIMLVPKNK